MAPVTPQDFADIAAREVCERVARALVDITDACDDEEPLTPRQKMLVGTALLRECMGLDADLERMFRNAAVIETWASRMPPVTLADEAEAWLATLEEPGAMQ